MVTFGQFVSKYAQLAGSGTIILDLEKNVQDINVIFLKQYNFPTNIHFISAF